MPRGGPWAPSGANAQGWRFVVLRSPELRAVVAKAAAHALEVIEPVYGMSRPAPDDDSRRARTYRATYELHDRAGEFTSVLFTQEHYPTASELLLGGSIFPAMENFLLAARAQGLGACLTSWASYGGEALLREAVGVPDSWMLAGHVVVGWPRGSHGPVRRRAARRRRLPRPLGHAPRQLSPSGSTLRRLGDVDPGRRPVMADVAEMAGVSVMTVSRVLNGFPGVADSTRQRVEDAVAALGYKANTAARVLAGGRSHTLGAIAVETLHFAPAHMLYGIEAAARAAGHVLSFVTMAPRRRDAGGPGPPPGRTGRGRDRDGHVAPRHQCRHRHPQRSAARRRRRRTVGGVLDGHGRPGGGRPYGDEPPPRPGPPDGPPRLRPRRLGRCRGPGAGVGRHAPGAGRTGGSTCPGRLDGARRLRGGSGPRPGPRGHGRLRRQRPDRARRPPPRCRSTVAPCPTT